MQLQLACEQTINCEKSVVHNLHQKNMLLAIITLETTMQTDSLIVVSYHKREEKEKEAMQ